MLHLTTAANGAESFYESGPDTPRMEGAQACPCPVVSTPRMEGAQANPNPSPSPHPNPNPNRSQEEVYAVLAEAAVEDFLRGINATIFAYGQTGTGKTYSMYGSEQALLRFTPTACKRP